MNIGLDSPGVKWALNSNWNRPNLAPLSSTWPDWVTDIVYLKDTVGGYLFWGWCHPCPTLACTGQFQCLHVLLANAAGTAAEDAIGASNLIISDFHNRHVTMLQIFCEFFISIIISGLSYRYAMLVAASLVGNFRVSSSILWGRWTGTRGPRV